MSVTAFAPETEARFAHARQVADAVLFEGYVLYPYRASSAKNRLRWQFGVLVPPAWGAERDEHDFQHTECLLEPRAGTTLAVELRFLRARRRTVQQVRPGGGFETVAELRLPDRVLVPWDEGCEERVEAVVTMDSLLDGDGVTIPFTRPAGEESEPVRDENGFLAGRVLRRYEQLDGALRLSARELDGPYRVVRLSAVVENTSTWTPAQDEAAGRDAALPRSLVASHLLMGLSTGSFLSMTDPPEWAKAAVAACRNLHTWPVLAGAVGQADLMLSSPIILEDHPAIAPESPGALYDATEIDEILALRTAALTDEEKREARGTDERAAAAVDLAESMPPEVLERLHGAVRGLREVTGPAPDAPLPDEYGLPPTDTPWWDPASEAGFDPAHDHAVVDGRTVAAGSRVRLDPGLRHTDAQDFFLCGRTAKVEAVLHDVDGTVHLAVTLDDDPGADIRREQGRFLYFQPDEVTLLEDDA
ncbi:hypothetical protein NGF19_15850 [Streptomyces sp. RY43-2]|uniref:Uncharacterized protein n=1 Tax=Streptomyces macrolidinus TaxID=2952607 RepID=A0ABT0ZFA0_9ACTN|nr:hypothetical protein [Streptomyces macrolidinus]MCN9242247.1 hypothetical protein [Streptomyces macrolidinus]